MNLVARQREGPELCFHTDLCLNPSSSAATCLTLSTFLSLEELCFFAYKVVEVGA